MNQYEWFQRMMRKRAHQREEDRGGTDVVQKSEILDVPVKRSVRSLPLLLPAIILLILGYIHPRLAKRLTAAYAFVSDRLDQLDRILRAFIADVHRIRVSARLRVESSLFRPVRLFFSAVGVRLGSSISYGFRGLQGFGRSMAKLIRTGKREYEASLKESDRVLDSVAENVEEHLEQASFALEGLEKRTGVQFSATTAWIRKRRFLRRSERWGFLVLKPDVFEEMPDSEIFFLLGRLHDRLTPFKQVLMLEKTQAAIQRNADWCRAEFSRTRGDWPVYAKDATLDPDSWYDNALEWIVKEVGRHHLVWNHWIVLPERMIPDAFYELLLRYVKDEEELYLNRLEYERNLYKLFHPLCDSEPEDMNAIEEFQNRLFNGERLWDVLAPDITSVEPWGIQTSSGAWMKSLQLYSLGSDIVDYRPADLPKEAPSKTELMVRDMDWLKQQLTQVLMIDPRRDQQIWLASSTVGLPNSKNYQSALQSHLATIDAWKEEERNAHTEPMRKYAEAILSFYNEVDKRTSTRPFQQSYSLLLKAGDEASLDSLRDRVEQVLETRDVLFEPSVAEFEHLDSLKRFLPVIWPEEVAEDYGIPRRSMPMTMEELKCVFKVPEIHPPRVGGIVGIMEGKPLVFGPGNFGVLGTTTVGKSFSLNEILLMTGPLAIAETEIFVVDIIGRKPNSDPGNWSRSIVQLLGGIEIFPSLFTSPEAMGAYLRTLLDKLAFLYNPDNTLAEAEKYDMQFLYFVSDRMQAHREESFERSLQLVFPSLQDLGVTGFSEGRPPRKKIRRRFFILDELENWLQRKDDPRTMFLTSSIMGQARKTNMSFFYSVKTMESAMLVNPGAWSNLKNLTDTGWLLFWTPDPQSVPQNITYPRYTPEEARRADLIVEYIKDIRRLGGMSKVEESYGQLIYATGDFISRAQFIAPPPLIEPMRRKTEEESEWSA